MQRPRDVDWPRWPQLDIRMEKLSSGTAAVMHRARWAWEVSGRPVWYVLRVHAPELCSEMHMRVIVEFGRVSSC